RRSPRQRGVSRPPGAGLHAARAAAGGGARRNRKLRQMPDDTPTTATSKGSGPETSPAPLSPIDSLQHALLQHMYVAERSLAVALPLCRQLGKPLLLEGEAGVGKTEVAKVMADLLQARLIRLQCYEGLDINTAVYEWNYTRQMLQIRLLEAQGVASREALHEIFSPEFLIKRPLLQAIEDSREAAPVLLIDELDRADEEFEAFLLESLSDWQVTVPEVGTLKAAHPPVVVLTSNRTREIHDALKRRCIYYWIDYPSLEKELRIVQTKAPQAAEQLSRKIVTFVQ